MTLKLTLATDIIAYCLMAIMYIALMVRCFRFFYAFTTPKCDFETQEQLIKDITNASAGGDDATAKPVLPLIESESKTAIEDRMKKLEFKHKDKSKEIAERV